MKRYPSALVLLPVSNDQGNKNNKSRFKKTLIRLLKFELYWKRKRGDEDDKSRDDDADQIVWGSNYYWITSNQTPFWIKDF